MTRYEIIATIIGSIALVQPWLIQAYNKFVKHLKISFIPSGKIKLFYNRSGAYLSLGGVIEAKNQSTVIKDISVRVIRGSDKAELNMDWSCFMVPIFQTIGNNTVTTNETARPFKVEANGLAPIFIEFANTNDKTLKRLKEIHNELKSKAMPLINYTVPAENTRDAFRALPEYIAYRAELMEDFYWKSCSYIVELTIKYDDKKTKIYRYTFDLDETEIAEIRKNVDMAMDVAVDSQYGITPMFSCPQKDFCEAEGV